jgi:hypothetical protein
MSGLAVCSVYTIRREEDGLKPDDLPDGAATSDEIRQAIESLSAEDVYRINKAAMLCLSGTEYQTGDEIINEAIVRTMNAASGMKGRRWPKRIPFVAYMIETLKGLASDSRKSSLQTKTDSMDAMAVSIEGVSVDDVLGRLEYYHQDVPTQAIELEETQERRDCAKADAEIIDNFFANDDEIKWIIMGHKDGLSVSEILELANMTQTQYETTRRRFRRGLEKLFPGRRKS